MKLDLITYGCGTEFDPVKFKPIKNRDFIKPDGGLWASPINSPYGWKEWCMEQEQGNLSSSFTFAFDGKVLVIDSLEDAMRMPWLTLFDCIQYPNFEQIAQHYDAIWLTTKGQVETRFSEPNMYGWDCETVLILNPDCIE